MRAAIYARISQITTAAVGPDQIGNATKYAERMGWRSWARLQGRGQIRLHGEVDARIRGTCSKCLTQGQRRRSDRPAPRSADPPPGDYGRLMKICVRSKIKISLYTGGVLDLATASGGFLGHDEHRQVVVRVEADQEPASQGCRAAQRQAGKRTGGGSRPFGYKIIRHDLGEGGKRRCRIIGEELEPAEAEPIRRLPAEC